MKSNLLSHLIDNKTLIVIAGPTASGKTALSIELSKLLKIEVISADSRQIYKYLDIGTSTPTINELEAVKTHFINILNPVAYYSAGKFGNDAELVAKDIISRGLLPVVVGGSGLYIQALCEGFFEDPGDEAKRNQISNELSKQLKDKGIESLYKQLKIVDTISAEKYSDMNPRRIIRALEFFECNGIPFSEAHKRLAKKRELNVMYFVIDIDREKLYKNINLRAELMWKSGIIEETKNVMKMGYSPDLISLNTVGYKEVIAFLNGELNEKEALALMQQNTRRYAKRQMTWFRKIPNAQWLKGNINEMAEEIVRQTEIKL